MHTSGSPSQSNVLEAYERLIHEAKMGDNTPFTAAGDIERPVGADHRLRRTAADHGGSLAGRGRIQGWPSGR